jgi:hypothetical protein
MVNTLLSLAGIDLIIFTMLGGLSLLPVIYFISVSFTFGYCLYHRLPIYYIILNDSINWLDYHIGIPIPDMYFIAGSIVLMFVFITVTIVLHIKEIKRRRHEINGSSKK